MQAIRGEIQGLVTKIWSLFVLSLFYMSRMPCKIEFLQGRVDGLIQERDNVAARLLDLAARAHRNDHAQLNDQSLVISQLTNGHSVGSIGLAPAARKMKSTSPEDEVDVQTTTTARKGMEQVAVDDNYNNVRKNIRLPLFLLLLLLLPLHHSPPP
ncbi:hypothetical protein SELMODRAFT_406017 [Selaginella moellendorffii]|uniref:Uncharacterized protein n=1 Tax=Selaginella moellendorffii TaxID=88036 RepID=D8R0E1_SELML|nr:hypothetical protein SELMODRAFT_406017 [Selaginella moellendorffii]